MVVPPASVPPPLPAAAEAVLTFLESIGRRSEAELYLRLFGELPRQSFALVATDAPVVRHALGSVLEQLQFLAALGLVAPVVVGAFSPERSQRGAELLAEHLPTVGLVPRQHDLDEPALPATLTRELVATEVPVLRFTGRAGESPLDRFARLGTLARELGSRKVVILRQRGGLTLREDQPLPLGPADRLLWDDRRVSVLNLRGDLPLLVEHGLLRQDDQKLAGFVEALLSAAGEHRALTVSVTEPWSLLRELFTVKGAGTLIKAGAEIEHHTSYDSVDRVRLTTLLERSFGRSVLPAFLERRPLSVYLEVGYRGAAILEPSNVGAFLTKFAVEPVAQGEGMGRDLWQALMRDHPRVLWRTAASNPVSSWYAGQCDGMVRLPRWHVFWRGLCPADIPHAIEYACAQPEDFVPRSSPAR